MYSINYILYAHSLSFAWIKLGFPVSDTENFSVTTCVSQHFATAFLIRTKMNAYAFYIKNSTFLERSSIYRTIKSNLRKVAWL